MKSTFLLSSEKEKKRCIDYISSVPLDEIYVVNICGAKEKRSSAQNRLKWLWMSFLEKEKGGEGHGYSKNDWNRFFKAKFLREILMAQDEEYVDFYKKADRLFKSALGEGGSATNQDVNFARLVILDNIKTEWLTSKSMQEFMSKIDDYCLNSLMIKLPVPSDLQWIFEKN